LTVVVIVAAVILGWSTTCSSPSIGFTVGVAGLVKVAVTSGTFWTAVGRGLRVGAGTVSGHACIDVAGEPR
jgi:hypothetical protein